MPRPSMMRVAVETEPFFRVGSPEEVFGTPAVPGSWSGLGQFALAPDRDGILTVTYEASTAGGELILLKNWVRELRDPGEVGTEVR